MGVYLGEADAPDLADLHDGERVALVEPNELRAIATDRRLTLDERPVWFAEIGDCGAIEVIYPDSSPDSSSAEHHDHHQQGTRTVMP